MDIATKKQLQAYATKIRIGIIEGTFNAKAGHPGGSLSSADLFAYLYFNEIRVNPQNPKWEDRDRFVLSKGHAAPGLYSALALKGFFPFEDMKTLRHIGSYLQGHPNMNSVAGVDMSTGSLGQGISTAVGMAKGAKLANKNDINVYALLGDGEMQEGQVWEALMFANQYKLDNLCVIIDYNGFQIDGTIDEVMSINPLDKKLEAFGFEYITVDGNDFDQLEKAFVAFHNCDKPFAIIMNTVKGKGVSYMENEVSWHGKAPNEEEYKIAMAELTKALAEIEEA